MDINEMKPVKVFSGTAWQASQLKDLLMDNDIEAFLGDEIWGTDAPITHTPDMPGGVNVYVAKDNFEDAKVVVERYYEEDITDDFI
jgi:hypothetical protein